MKNDYYIAIDSNNLGIYFSNALITPKKYIKNDISDFQSKNKSAIILSKKFIGNDADCWIKVILSNDEVKKIKKDESGDCFYYYSAIPITRISSINFLSKEKMERVIDLARSSAFIPERLINVVDPKKIKLTSHQLSKENSSSDLSNLIEKYNRYLGGVAFMKFGGENYMNYSKNYFSTFSYFSVLLDKEISKVNLNIDFDIKLQGIFDKSNRDWKKWQNIIFGGHSDLVSVLKNKVRYSNSLYHQDNVKDNKELYILSILANYGTSLQNSKRTDSLLKAMISNRIYYREVVSLFYGLYNGYQKLKKNYHIEKQMFRIKNELASKLDYYLIESVFQFVFYGSKNVDIKFLSHNLPINSKEKIDKKKFLTYTIFDEDIIFDIKPQSLKEVLTKYFSKEKFSGILNSLSKKFEKKEELKLTKEQRDKKNLQYFTTVSPALQEFQISLLNEIEDFHSNKLNLLENKVKYYENEFRKITNFINKPDNNNLHNTKPKGASIFNVKEIIDIINKLKIETKQLQINSIKEKNEELLKKNISNYKLSDNIAKFGESEDIYDSENKILKLHSFYLERLSVKELSKIAIKKGLNIKVSKENKKQIIEKVLVQITNEPK